MKIGILGGSFDPPHTGHILLAENALKQCRLDKIIMLPAAKPPHKTTSTDSLHRLKLASIVAENYGYELSDYEYNKETPSYTNDTIDYFKMKYPDDEIFFIIGGDSMIDFEKWYKWQELIKKCKFIVGIRDEKERELVASIVNEKEKKYGAEIILLDSPAHEVSSSEIRKGFAAEEIPQCIKAYIKENALYKDLKL